MDRRMSLYGFTTIHVQYCIMRNEGVLKVAGTKEIFSGRVHSENFYAEALSCESALKVLH